MLRDLYACTQLYADGCLHKSYDYSIRLVIYTCTHTYTHKHFLLIILDVVSFSLKCIPIVY